MSGVKQLNFNDVFTIEICKFVDEFHPTTLHLKYRLSNFNTLTPDFITHLVP